MHMVKSRRSLFFLSAFRQECPVCASTASTVMELPFENNDSMLNKLLKDVFIQKS